MTRATTTNLTSAFSCRLGLHPIDQKPQLYFGRYIATASQGIPPAGVLPQRFACFWPGPEKVESATPLVPGTNSFPLTSKNTTNFERIPPTVCASSCGRRDAVARRRDGLVGPVFALYDQPHPSLRPYQSIYHFTYASLHVTPVLASSYFASYTRLCIEAAPYRVGITITLHDSTHTTALRAYRR